MSDQLSIFADASPPEQQTLHEARPDATFYDYVVCNWQHLIPNMHHGAFDDFRVRRAFWLAIDYDEIGNGYHGDGWGDLAVLHQAFPEAWDRDRVRSLPGKNPDTKEEDRQEAHELLAAAGHEDGAGISFTLLNKPKDDNRENSVRFQDQMRNVFPAMEVNLAEQDGATFADSQSSSQFEMISNDSTQMPDAVLEAMSRFHSGGSRNYGQFENAEADELLERALLEQDDDARTELLDEFQQRWFDEWLTLWTLYGTPRRHFLQPDIGGFELASGPWDFYRSHPAGARFLYQV